MAAHCPLIAGLFSSVRLGLTASVIRVWVGGAMFEGEPGMGVVRSDTPSVIAQDPTSYTAVALRPSELDGEWGWLEK